MKKVILVVLALGMGACTAQTLDEKLAGKSGAERMEVLYHDCVQRANYTTVDVSGDYVIGHEIRERQLCDRMYKATVNGASDSEKAGLARQCGVEISRGYKASSPDNAKHFNHMRNICEGLTGKHVSIRQ